MNRFFVIEARRLLPLLFLLVLLVSLSIYDNFIKDQPVVAPDNGIENTLAFITYDRGDIAAPAAAFQVVASTEEWSRLKEEHGDLPDYPFNAAYEFALSATHGEIRRIQLFPQEDGLVQVQVSVAHAPNLYHVVTVEREQVGERSRWIFLDEDDRILQEVVLPQAVEYEEDGE